MLPGRAVLLDGARLAGTISTWLGARCRENPPSGDPMFGRANGDA